MWCGLQVVKALAALNTANSSAVGAFLEDAAAAAQPPDQPASPLHPSSSDHAVTAAAAGGNGGGSGTAGDSKTGGHPTDGAPGGSANKVSDDWQALSVQS